MRRTVLCGTRAVPALLVVLVALGGIQPRAAQGEGLQATRPVDGVLIARALAPALAADDDQEGDAAAPMGLYRGTVTDRRSGKPVAGAVVVFINEESGDTYESTSDANGVYEARLPAGEYVVDIRVGKKTYRSSGSFREEASGKRWVMDFTVGTKLTEKDVKIETTPRDVRIMQTEPRAPLEASKKKMEFWIFIGTVLGVAALSE